MGKTFNANAYALQVFNRFPDDWKRNPEIRVRWDADGSDREVCRHAQTRGHNLMAAKRRAKGKAPAILRLPNGWDPRWYQRDFWDYFEGGGKRGVAIACRRWGKDDVALHRTAVGAHERTATYWHLLPEYAQGRKAIWDAVNPHTGKRRIDEAFPEHLRSHTDERGMFMRFTCGSTWQVIGSDNFNSVVGSPPYGIVFSEWALSNPAAWAYLSPILEENGGWAMFITTPRGRNHGASFYERALKTPGWFALRQGVNDIGILAAAARQHQGRARRSVRRGGRRKPVQSGIPRQFRCGDPRLLLREDPGRARPAAPHHIGPRRSELSRIRPGTWASTT